MRRMVCPFVVCKPPKTGFSRQGPYMHICIEKQLKDIKILFDYITFEKIISKQIIFVFDRTTDMQFRKMQNKIYGSLVTIQCHTKCTNPLYPKFTSKQFSIYKFCCNLYLVIAYVLILTKEKCSHPILSVIAPSNMTTLSTKMHRYGMPQPI